MASSYRYSYYAFNKGDVLLVVDPHLEKSTPRTLYVAIGNGISTSAYDVKYIKEGKVVYGFALWAHSNLGSDDIVNYINLL